MNNLNFESKGEARSYFHMVNNPKFPEVRSIEEVNDGMHLGDMTDEQFAIVLRDLAIARAENREMYLECRDKVIEKPQWYKDAVAEALLPDDIPF